VLTISRTKPASCNAAPVTSRTWCGVLWDTCGQST
jgi:hypothetical protein